MTIVLELGLIFLVTATWLSVVFFLFAKPDQLGRLWLRSYCAELDKKLRALRKRYPGIYVLYGQLSTSASLLVFALATGHLVPLTFLPVIALAPKVQLERLVAKRVTAIENQIEPWLNAVANALKASASLGEAIAASVSLLTAPMSEEIDLLHKEYELGSSLDKALEQMAERIGSTTLNGAVLALQIARNSGGNLPEMLENAASALRELARLEGVVRTKTAEGKAQAFVIGAIPIPMVVGIHAMDNQFFTPLIATFTGNLVISSAVGLWVIAILLASKILAVDI
jgi:tight adherence protein B